MATKDDTPVCMGDVPRLRMQGVRKRFNATVALDGVDLQVSAGEVLALVGENGAGKSTLMKILSGAYRPDEGLMWLDGREYRPRGPMDARRAGVAMIYQELSLAPHLSVTENITLGMEPVRGFLLDRAKMRRIAGDALEVLDRPGIPIDAPVGELSLAEQQLVEIARAVAVGCRVLVLDEPTSSLTLRDIEVLFSLVRRLRQKGHAIVYISHFLEEVTSISDRYSVLRDGRTVGGGPTSDASHDRIVELMVGRSVDQLYPRSNRTPGEEILSLHSLASFAKPVDASLSLRRGEVFGIVGLVGAGRTEMLEAIFGLKPIVGGKIKFAAFSGPATPGQRLRQGMGMLSEDRKNEGLALSLSIADNITMSRTPMFETPTGRALKAAKWIGEMDIRCQGPWQETVNLSGGNQQKAAIARLLHHDVDVLLLDEPTRGIDVGAKALIYQTIDRLAASGRAVLIVSSYLPELLGICDRVAVMRKGVLGTPRPAGRTNEHELMLEATGA